MTEPTPKLSGDFPRSDPEHDELGRKQFCEKLAQILAKGHDSGSTVIAIYGAWGVGKTTAKNFAVHFLRKDHGIEAIEFEPWGWSGRDKVVEALFTKLEVALGKADMRETKKWVESARRVLGLSIPFLDIAKLVWPAIGTLLSLGFVWLGSTYALDQRWVAFVLCGLVGLCGVAAAGHKLAKAIEDYNADVKAARFAALEDVRAGLVRELSTRGKALVVTIDDIDRLEPVEIRQVVQVVKAVANLPHVVFLLLFQRDVVTRALDEVAGQGKGQEFLEKIVQVGFHVPEPPPGRIMAMLDSALTELKKDPRFARYWDDARWERAVRPPMKGYFRNARDVARFTSALTVYVDQHMHGGSFEVNPLDLVGLEAIRMFEPALFERLSAVPLVGPSEMVEALMPVSKEFKQRRELDLEALTKLVSEENRATGGQLLRALFPQLASHYEADPAVLDKCDVELRVCHHYHYAKYFDLNLLPDRATAQDFQALMAAGADVQQLANQLQRLSEQKLLPDVLVRLGTHLAQQSIPVSENFAHVLPGIGEDLPDQRAADEGAGAKENAAALTIQALRQVPDMDRRYEVWLEAVKATNALDLTVYVTAVLESLAKKNDPMNSALTTQEQAAKLTGAALERIRVDARDGRLISRPWFWRHIYRWAEWSSPEETKAWASGFMTDAASARCVLVKLKQDIISYGSTIRRIPQLAGEDLDRLIGFDLLDRRLSIASTDKEKSPDENTALLLYAEAKKLKGAGRPYNQVTLPGSDFWSSNQ